MTSQSRATYAARGQKHAHPVARHLFEIAELKQSNLVVSADLYDSKSLLELADRLGPYIAVFKTHVDLVSDFSADTVKKLNELKKKHNFMIFEDRKLIDIGHTVQRQYHGGSLRLSQFADVVNISPLSGDGILEALAQTLTGPDFPYVDERALLILAEMTTHGSMAVGPYTNRCIDLARKYSDVVIGFVATRALTDDLPHRAGLDEDFITFTTGVNMSAKGDSLGQQYQHPATAIARGSDFVIAGRGIYAASDPVKAAKAYQEAGWEAYLARINTL